jgi:hypothetical protein
MSGGLPDGPLPLVRQATVVDVEPSTRYGHRYDGASVNTALALANDGTTAIEFPLILATTDPENRDPGRSGPATGEDEGDWGALLEALRANGVALGYRPERLDAFLARLRATVERASKSRRVELAPGARMLVRTNQRKLLGLRAGVFAVSGLYPLPQFVLGDGGELSVVVALPLGAEPVEWAPPASPQLIAERAVLAWTARGEARVSYRYRT